MKSKTELAEGIFTKIVGTMKATLLTNEHDEKFKKRWVRHMEDLAEASLVAAEVFQKKTSATLPAVVAAEEKVTKAPEWDLRPGTVVKAVANFDKEVLPVLEGDYGVVFEHANEHGDGAGPCVRWFRNNLDGEINIIGVCNVGKKDVTVLREF